MNEGKLKIKLYAVTLDCKDAYGLAKFYASLLDWQIVFHNEEFACLGAPDTAQGEYPGITFQQNCDYVPPVWPEEKGSQQQMAHMDFAVNDLKESVAHAIACGAKIASEQYSDGWTVMLDPEGHPFCLCLLSALFQTERFALR